MKLTIATYNYLMEYNIFNSDVSYISEKALFYGTILNKNNIISVYRT